MPQICVAVHWQDVDCTSLDHSSIVHCTVLLYYCTTVFNVGTTVLSKDLVQTKKQ